MLLCPHCRQINGHFERVNGSFTASRSTYDHDCGARFSITWDCFGRVIYRLLSVVAGRGLP